MTGTLFAQEHGPVCPRCEEPIFTDQARMWAGPDLIHVACLSKATS